MLLRQLPGEFFVERLRKNPLRLTAFASSPKGTPLSYAGNFAATAKSRPLGEGGTATAVTEGVTRSAALSQKAALQMQFAATRKQRSAFKIVPVTHFCLFA